MQHSFILFIAVVCLFAIVTCVSYDDDEVITRRVRTRSGSKKISAPISTSSIESFVVHKQPEFVEGGNGWKPMYDVPTHTVPSTNLKRRKQIRPAPKYPIADDIIYGTQQYSKPEQPYSTTNFIANQSLLVSDYSAPTKRLPSKSKSNKRQRTVEKTPQQQYEVHEYITDDVKHDSTQNRFRYQDIPVGKSSTGLVKYPETAVTERHVHHMEFREPAAAPGRFRYHEPLAKPLSNKYPESLLTEKHYHHMHYHDDDRIVTVRTPTRNIRKRRPYY